MLRAPLGSALGLTPNPVPPGGFALLPFLWLVNVLWFFREAFLAPAYTQQLQIKSCEWGGGSLGGGLWNRWEFWGEIGALGGPGGSFGWGALGGGSWEASGFGGALGGLEGVSRFGGIWVGWLRG